MNTLSTSTAISLSDRLARQRQAFLREGTPSLKQRRADLAKLKSCMLRPVVFDGRNLFDPAGIRAAGFTYFSMGRG